MTSNIPFPLGFTPGLPTHGGTYVLLTVDLGFYGLHVREIHEVPKDTAEMLGVKPGLCVINDFECFEYMNVEDWSIIGFMELEGVSAFDLWMHRGKLKLPPPYAPDTE